jgi:hypothetical protein
MRTNGHDGHEHGAGCEETKPRPAAARAPRSFARALLGVLALGVFALLATAIAGGCVLLYRVIVR